MRIPLALVTAATTLTLLAGCGSSSKSSSTAHSAPASQPAAASTSTSAAPAAATAAGTVIVTKRAKLGTILAAGPKRLTVYLFEADKGQTPSCSGACTKLWPPVTTSGAPSAHAGAASADLGTVTRSDGTVQVTYKGHPLYYYARDGDAGDAYGQGINSFGAGWYVLKPSGEKLDNS